MNVAVPLQIEVDDLKAFTSWLIDTLANIGATEIKVSEPEELSD